MSNTNNTTRPSWQAGLAGGCGGCGAALLTHPIELLKVRFQLRGELQTTLSVGTTTTSSSVIKTVANIFRTEGFPGFYRGLSASLLRQALFTSSRFAVYGQYKETVGEWYNSRFTNNTNNNNNTGLSKNRTLPLYAQLIGTVFAGTIGAIVSCPTDVVLIRMQADGRLPLEQRRNYSNVLVGLTRVAREEGVSALYRGVASNIYRASIVTSCQLVSYDAAKNFLLNSPLLHTKLELKLKDNIVTHFFSGIFAGIVTTLIASPVDIIRTRYMNSMDEFLKKQNQSSAIQFYRSPIDCVVKTVRTEGFLALYKGSFVYCLRVMPHVTSMFLLVEGSNRVIDRVRALL